MLLKRCIYFHLYRLLSAVENIVALEKMPAAFSQFEPCAGGFTNSDRTLQLMHGKKPFKSFHESVENVSMP